MFGINISIDCEKNYRFLKDYIVWGCMLLSKSIVVKVPPWISEEEVKKILEAVLARLGGRVDVSEVREMLGIKSEELTEDIEVYDVGELRRKEKERLP